MPEHFLRVNLFALFFTVLLATTSVELTTAP